MRENVVRAFTRWGPSSDSMAYDGGVARIYRISPSSDSSGCEIQACEAKSAFYKPGAEEPLVSLVISSDVAHRLTLSVLLRREVRDRIEEIIVGEVPGVAFMDIHQNKVPFHGDINKDDEYEVRFTNISNASIYLSAAVLVNQP